MDGVGVKAPYFHPRPGSIRPLWTIGDLMHSREWVLGPNIDMILVSFLGEIYSRGRLRIEGRASGRSLSCCWTSWYRSRSMRVSDNLPLHDRAANGHYPRS